MLTVEDNLNAITQINLFITETPKFNIDTGSGHSCSINNLGGLKCWGMNDRGQLGDGSYIDKLTPVNVATLSSGVEHVSTGGRHTCALMSTNEVKCWGNNGSGELGDGTVTTKWGPVYITSNISRIDCGGSHTCALTTAGGVKCWGYNYSGQLGDGTNTTRLYPTSINGLNSDIVDITTGSSHTCSLSIIDGVKCWGYNSYGTVGDGTTTSRSNPVNVVGLTSGVKDIVAGGNHTCALMTSGEVKCWGNNWYGQLGDGTTTNRLIPVNVIGLTSDVFKIAAGGDTSCALMTSGEVKCWGNNQYGQIGDGTTINQSYPINVIGLTSGVSNIAIGGIHTCALLTSGAIKCWGYNINGQLGDSTSTNRLTPVDVIGF